MSRWLAVSTLPTRPRKDCATHAPASAPSATGLGNGAAGSRRRAPRDSGRPLPAPRHSDHLHLPEPDASTSAAGTLARRQRTAVGEALRERGPWFQRQPRGCISRPLPPGDTTETSTCLTSWALYSIRVKGTRHPPARDHREGRAGWAPAAHSPGADRAHMSTLFSMKSRRSLVFMISPGHCRRPYHVVRADEVATAAAEKLGIQNPLQGKGGMRKKPHERHEQTVSKFYRFSFFTEKPCVSNHTLCMYSRALRKRL